VAIVERSIGTVGKIENEMIRWGRLLFERHLISGWGGNLSCRISKQFLITGQHAPLPFLTAKDLVRLDAQGKPLRKTQRASSETLMHMAVYAGTDAQAIVHVHPPMVLAFSLTHDSFVPISFEEKYTIGEVPIIAQDTPTVTKPEKLVEALRYHPVAIIKGHGTVAIGKDLQEAFLLTDLLEEAVHCQFFRAGLGAGREATEWSARDPEHRDGKRHQLFSEEHIVALVESANSDREFRELGSGNGLTTSLTLQMEENGRAWTVRFRDGEITETTQAKDGDFLISGAAEWWNAVFTNKIDPFMATQQGKLKLRRGELAQLSRWYKPFQRAFSLWQNIPIQ
jgi:L-fuculose-phosphate aldolase